MFHRICQLPAVRLLAAMFGLGLILFLYGWFQHQNFTPGYSEDDPDGYLFLARRLLAHKPPWINDPDIFTHQKHFWVENHLGQLTSKYPLGFPILLALAQLIGGDQGIFLVSPIMGGLTLVGVYLIARIWLNRPYSLIACLALVFNGMFEFFSGYLLTHAAEVCFITWGTLLLLHLLRTSEWPIEGEPAPIALRPWRAILFAILGGQLLGFACAIRYTSAAMALPVAWVAMVFLWRYRKASILARLPAYALVASFGVIPILCGVYNHIVFGAFYRTGYALTDEQGNYTWEHFIKGSHVLLSGMNNEVGFMLFPLALVAIFALVSRVHRILFLLTIVPLFLVYSSYYWTPYGQHYFRFMLFSVAVLVPMAFVAISRLQGPPKARRWALLAVMVLVLFDAYPRMIETGLSGQWYAGQQGSGAMNQFLASSVSPDAIVFTGSPELVHEGAVGGLKVYSLAAFDAGPRPAPTQWDPLGQGVRFDWNKTFYKVTRADALLARKLSLIRTYMEQRRPVVMVLPKGRVGLEQRQLGKEYKLRQLGEIMALRWGQPVVTTIYQLVPTPIVPPSTSPSGR